MDGLRSDSLPSSRDTNTQLKPSFTYHKPEGREAMKTERPFTELMLAENDTALEYSENPEALKRLMEKITVHYRREGRKLYFKDDKDEREVLTVTITRGERTIQFNFGMSINDTDTLYSKGKSIDPGTYRESIKYNEAIERATAKIFSGLLYSLLCICGSEYHCEKSFSDFCSECGYDEDSRKAEKTHRLCLEQSAKLEKIFTEEEVQALPR